jgi:hypothetical protein
LSNYPTVPIDISNNSFSYIPVDFDTIFSELILQYNTYALVPADTSVGSTLWAIFKSAALSFAEQSQQIVGQGGVINISRLAYCIGSDVDSFCNQFNVIRQQGVGSSGQITVSTNSPLTAEAVLYVGTTIGSDLGDETFVVTADPTNPAYSATSDGYVAAAGTNSVTATASCSSTGYITNVQAGELNLFLSSPSGTAIQFANVTNALAFTNGIDGETDAAYKTRFVIQVVGGGTATTLACVAQALLASVNLSFAVGDPWNYRTGIATPGYFVIYLSSLGTGVAVPSTIIGNAQSLVNAVRSGGIVADVLGAAVYPVSVSMQIKLMPGASAGVVGPAVQAAIATYLNNIQMSGNSQSSTTMNYGRLFVAAYGVPGVSDVIQSSFLVNGASPEDLTIAFGSQFVAGTINITTA